MRKNQKYTQEEMYLAIEMWKESGLSQKQYCKQENLAHSTFQYWHEKYKGNNPNKRRSKLSASNSFIPVQVTKHDDIITTPVMEENITITYPNGVQISCPITIPEYKLKSLIKL